MAVGTYRMRIEGEVDKAKIAKYNLLSRKHRTSSVTLEHFFSLLLREQVWRSELSVIGTRRTVEVHTSKS